MALRHMTDTVERCCLPALTRFTGCNCTGSGPRCNLQTFSLLHGHAGRDQQVLREDLADDDGEEIDVEDAGRRLRRADLRRLPGQVGEHRRAGEAEQDPLSAAAFRP